MTPERINELNHNPSPQTLTPGEMAEGWHWCMEFDDLLVGPGCGELRCCSCLPKDHPVYKTAPRSSNRLWLLDWEDIAIRVVREIHLNERLRQMRKSAQGLRNMRRHQFGSNRYRYWKRVWEKWGAFDEEELEDFN